MDSTLLGQKKKQPHLFKKKKNRKTLKSPPVSITKNVIFRGKPKTPEHGSNEIITAQAQGI